jgi:hypothetical protein
VTLVFDLIRWGKKMLLAATANRQRLKCANFATVGAFAKPLRKKRGFYGLE